MMVAVKKALIITPVSSNVDDSRPPWRLLIPITKKMVNSALKKERRGTPTVNPSPKIIPIMAPTAAPLEIPSTNGSARGFLRRA